MPRRAPWPFAVATSRSAELMDVQVQVAGAAEHAPVITHGLSVRATHGRAMGLGTAPVTIWSQLSRYVFPSAPTLMTFSSASADDDSGGIGLRSMVILGLAADHVLTIELVEMTGQTPGNSGVAWLRILDLFGVDVGSAGENVGPVYLGTGVVTAGVPATVFGVIDAGIGQSTMAVDSVPAGKQLVITSAFLSTGQGRTIDADLFIRKAGQCWRSKLPFTGTEAHVPRSFDFPLVIPEKSDIEIRGSVDAANADVSCGFGGYWEDVTVVE